MTNNPDKIQKAFDALKIFTYRCRYCGYEWASKYPRIDKPEDLCDDCIAQLASKEGGGAQ